MCLKESSATERMWLGENGEFADLGAGISYLGVFTFGLICFHLAVYPDGDFSHLIMVFFVKIFDALFLARPFPSA